jgi:hypothetical protein
MTDPALFFSEFDDVLTDIDGLDDETAAATLVEFLEGHREEWPAIKAAARRRRRSPRADRTRASAERTTH